MDELYSYLAMLQASGQLPPGETPESIINQQLGMQQSNPIQDVKSLYDKYDQGKDLYNTIKGFGAAGGAGAAGLAGGASGAVGMGATGALTGGLGGATMGGIGSGAAGIASSAAAGAGVPMGGATTGGLGALAAPIALGGVALNQMYEGGGKNILKNQAHSGDWANTAMYAAFPPLAVFDGALKALGLGSVAKGVTGALGLKMGPQTKQEDKRLEELIKQGKLPADYVTKLTDKNRAEQVAELKASGSPVSKFLETGNEADLTPEDIQGYARLLEKSGDLNERLKLGKDYLAAGAVKEHHGTIDLDEKKYKKWQETNSMIPVAKEGMGSSIALSPSSLTGEDMRARLKGKIGSEIDPGFTANVGDPRAKSMLGQVVGNATQAMIPKASNGVTSGLAFDPNSAQYKGLSKDQKNQYWSLRNSGK